MAITQVNAYLNTNGDGQDAIKLYERVLGAKVETLQTFGDIPGNTPKPEHANRVIHALLRVGPGVLMLSDGPSDRQAPRTSNAHVCLAFDDVADMTAKFEGLAQGGTVTMPLQDTFWGARFGMLTDRHGIHWMFNCEKKA
jgi:PhnB protein